MKDENFFNFDGSPKEGIRATRTEVAGDNELTKAQFSAAKSEYAKFNEMKNLSLAKTFNTWKTLPDGTIIHISSSYGQDRVSIKPSGGSAKIVFPFFNGIPCSDTWRTGYTTQAVAPTWFTDNYVSKYWFNYPYSGPPENLGYSRPVIEHRGETTWVNPDLKFRNQPVVVAWKGPQHRYGWWSKKYRHEYLIEAYFINEYPFFPLWGPNYIWHAHVFYPTGVLNSPHGTVPQYFGFQNADSLRRDSAVWINGVKVNTGSNVFSACLWKDESGPSPKLYLYVFRFSTFFGSQNTQLIRYKMPALSTFFAFDLGKNGYTPEQDPDFTPVSFNFDRIRGQIPYFNKSGTRFGGIFCLKYTLGTAAPPGKTLQMVSTEVFSDVYYPVHNVAGEYDIETATFLPCIFPVGGSTIYDVGSTGVVGGYSKRLTDFTYWYLMAADYIGDDLTYFAVKQVLDPDGNLTSSVYKGNEDLGPVLLQSLGTAYFGPESPNDIPPENQTYTGMCTAQLIGNIPSGDYVIFCFSPRYKWWPDTFISYTDHIEKFGSREARAHMYIDHVLVETQNFNLGAPGSNRHVHDPALRPGAGGGNMFTLTGNYNTFFPSDPIRWPVYRYSCAGWGDLDCYNNNASQ